MEGSVVRPAFNAWARWAVAAVTAALLFAWLAFTPPGLLGKADAVGYSVCHRIDARSFHLGDRPLPLCARCSGTFLAAALGLVYQAVQSLRQTRSQGAVQTAGWPPLPVAALFAAFVVAWGVDGLNSYLHLFPADSPLGAWRLYEPNNTLRLLTGTGMGLAIAAVLWPVFSQTIWKATPETSATGEQAQEPDRSETGDPAPSLPVRNPASLGSIRQVLGLLGAAVVVDAAILTENPLLLYPLALLSALGVIFLLTVLYALIWVMVFRAENRFSGYRQLGFPLLGGFTTALLQVALIDLGRYWFTGTWQGFSF
jgi:uncharacterized membrane protein